MLDVMSDSIQPSRIEYLHSTEVDRQSPTGLIFTFGVGHSFHHKRAEFQGSASLGCFQVSHAFSVVQMPVIDNIPFKNIFKLQNKTVLKNYILRMENKNTSACAAVSSGIARNYV